MNIAKRGYRIWVQDHRKPGEREFEVGQNLEFDPERIASALSACLTPRMEDLLRICSTVYFVDRLLPRIRKRGQAKWRRGIGCRVELREPDFWNQSRILDLLEETVGFVSGDSWGFSFVRERDCCQRDRQPFFEELGPNANSMICLYSGGLDSAAGLASRLQSGVGGQVDQILPVVVRHRSDVGDMAREQLRHLTGHFAVPLRPVVAPIEIKSASEIGATENSQRARAFLFTSVGGVVAWAIGASEIELYESGIGAVNAPLSPYMEGSHATRSCHPFFLSQMSRLLSEVADRQIRFVLPFEWATKGEVARSLSCGDLRSLAQRTVSCVSYPLRTPHAKSCGLCPACIFRRLALHTAGIEEDTETYDFDLLDPKQRTKTKGHRRKMKYLRAFLLMADQLAELDSGCLPVSLERHLVTTGILEHDQPQQPYIHLYQRYRQEWLSFVELARANGCKWSEMIDLPARAA